jgi:hypothetical protein
LLVWNFFRGGGVESGMNNKRPHNPQYELVLHAVFDLRRSPSFTTSDVAAKTGVPLLVVQSCVGQLIKMGYLMKLRRHTFRWTGPSDDEFHRRHPLPGETPSPAPAPVPAPVPGPTPHDPPGPPPPEPDAPEDEGYPHPGYRTVFEMILGTCFELGSIAPFTEVEIAYALEMPRDRIRAAMIRLVRMGYIQRINAVKYRWSGPRADELDRLHPLVGPEISVRLV